MEPTKVCTVCQERKPWSAFYTTRTGNPRWACAKCECALAAERLRRRRQENPEPFRTAQRERYHKAKQDPEWLAMRRDYGRLAADRRRRKRGIPERSKRGPTHGLKDPSRETVPAAPFAAWLASTMKTTGLTYVQIGELAGVSERRLRAYAHGEVKQADLSIVERVLLWDGDTTLIELYPELFEVAKSATGV